MSRCLLVLSRPALFGLVAGAALLGSPAAMAQGSSCQDAAKFLNERKTLGEQLAALSKKSKGKLEPRSACSLFTKLVGNGDAVMKWMEVNKDWCQVPDQFVEGLKQDHTRMVEIKGQACNAAAKLAELEKKAKQQAQQGGPMLGGGGLTGEYKIPQGAL